MTPKEKAKELYIKFSDYCSWGTFEEEQDFIKNIKNCISILVDEMIVEIYNIDHQHRAIYNPETGYYSYSDSKELLFWKEVKQEIENL